MTTVLKNFESWKQFLGDRVAHAKNIGMSEQAIAGLAFEIGSFLDQKVDPKNEEQRVLKEIWDVGTDQDRQTIARLMVKLAEKESAAQS